MHAEPAAPVHLRAGVRVSAAKEERRQGGAAVAPLGPHRGPGAAGAHGPAAVPGRAPHASVHPLALPPCLRWVLIDGLHHQ